MPTYRVNSKGIAVGKSGNDLVYGNNKDNVLVGAGGDDILRGRGGIDIIDAGNGNDTLFGESGNDMLSGGYGLDTLVGGSGSDFFAFDTRPSINNIDVVDDFSVKYDTIFSTRSSSKFPPTLRVSSSPAPSGPALPPTIPTIASSMTTLRALSITIRTGPERKPRCSSLSSMRT